MTQAFSADMERLQQLLQPQPDSDQLDDSLSDQIHQLIDDYSEREFIGLADALALLAELIEQLPAELESDHRVILQDSAQALLDLVSLKVPMVWQYLLACLSDPRWPEPVDEEDCGFLAELLEQDLLKLQQTEAAESAPHNDQPESHQDSDGPVAQFLQQLHNSATEPQSIALLQQYTDIFSEEDLPGLADLLALSSELLEAGGAPGQSERLIADLVTMLSTASSDAVGILLQGMTTAEWSEPLPQDDCEFLEEILLQDMQRLRSEDSIVDVTTELVDKSVAATEQPEPPGAFCQIDFALLEQPGPEIDPAILTMLTGTLNQLLPLWQQGSSAESSLLPNTLNQLEPVERALQTLHLHGAIYILQGLVQNFRYLEHTPERLNNELIQQIEQILLSFIAYFEDIGDKSRHGVLLGQIQNSVLPSVPEEEQAGFIRGLLALASIESLDSLEQEQACDADLLLQVADDIDPQLLDMLFAELPQQSEQLIEHLQQSTDLDEQRAAQRIAHTIKGLANMAGITGLANLTHRLEDILELLTEAAQLPNSHLSEAMLAAADTIAGMSDAVTAGGAVPQDSLIVLQLLMDWYYQLKVKGVAEGLESVASDTDDNVENVADQSEITEATQQQAAVDESDAETRQEEQFHRVAQSTLNSLLRLTGESSTLNTQLDEEITQLRSYTRVGRDRQRALQRVMFELEQQLNEHYTLRPGLDADSADFDPLEMDRYNEMHTSLSRLQEAAADIREVEDAMDRHIRRTGELHIAQNGLQKEILERVISTRLVEVKTISSRVQRIMRQACRAAGKEAILVIEGEQTRIDSQILNQLADPLMHIIRNAVDHGLESAEQRKASGKQEQGQLTLKFWLDNDLIRVTCQDDGAGIDTAKVRQVALDKQLIDSEAQLSTQDLQRLILMPGFSTRDQISQLSGRGIGMDVVHQQVIRLQGSLDIRSTAGIGTTFELSMPANSLMIKTLLVRSGQQIYALASHGLEQSLISLDGKLHETESGLIFDYGEESYPAYALESLLSEAGNPYRADEVYPVLLVNLGQGERVAVLVREVIAHRELAFKEMGDYLPDIPGIPGLTILANGDTAPVVDLPARIRSKLSTTPDLLSQPENISVHTLPKLLVVDDSISARSTLSVLLQDTGYDVRTAIDGLDALNQIRKDSPDLVLTDMEMPRMTGMELTSMMKSRQEMADIPVIMITSRTSERHQKEASEVGVASFMSKPWTETGLLQQVEELLQLPEPIH